MRKKLALAFLVLLALPVLADEQLVPFIGAFSLLGTTSPPVHWSKILANNTTTTIGSFSVPVDSSATAVLHYGCIVRDGSHNVQYEAGVYSCGVNNSNGTIAQNTCTKSGQTQGVTGVTTLAVTITVTAANPALLQVNCNSSTTPSSNYPLFNMDIWNEGLPGTFLPS